MKTILGIISGILLLLLFLLPESKIKKYLFRFLVFMAGISGVVLFFIFLIFIFTGEGLRAIWPLFYSALEHYLDWSVGIALSTPFPLLLKILFFIIDVIILIPFLLAFFFSWLFAALAVFFFAAIAIEGFFYDLLSKKTALFGASVLNSAIWAGAHTGTTPFKEYENISSQKQAPPGIYQSALFWMTSLFVCFFPFFLPEASLQDSIIAIGAVSTGGIGILLAIITGHSVFSKKSKKEVCWMILEIVALTFAILFIISMVILTLKESSFRLWLPITIWVIGAALFFLSLNTMWKKPKLPIVKTK